MNKIKEWFVKPLSLKELRVDMFIIALFSGFDLGSAIFEFAIHRNIIGWFDIGASLCCLAILSVLLLNYSKLKGGK